MASLPAKRGAILRLILMAGVAIVAWHTIPFRDTWSTLVRGTPGFFAVAIALAAVDRVVMGLKWQQLIHAAGDRIPLGQVASAYFQATFVGHVLPSAVTSEILRGFLVIRHGLGRATTIFSMAAERLIGAAATVTLGLAAVPVLGLHVAPSRIAIQLSAVAVLGLAAATVAAWRMRAVLATRLAAIFHRLQPPRLPAGRRLYGVLAINFLLAVGEQLLQAFVVLFVAAAVGAAEWNAAFFAALVAITSVRRVVAYLESWGLAEGVSVALYVAIGIDPAEGAAIAIGTYAVLVVAVIPGAILLLRRPSAERWPSSVAIS